MDKHNSIPDIFVKIHKTRQPDKDHIALDVEVLATNQYDTVPSQPVELSMNEIIKNLETGEDGRVRAELIFPIRQGVRQQLLARLHGDKDGGTTVEVVPSGYEKVVAEKAEEEAAADYYAHFSQSRVDDPRELNEDVSRQSHQLEVYIESWLEYFPRSSDHSRNDGVTDTAFAGRYLRQIFDDYLNVRFIDFPDVTISDHRYPGFTIKIVIKRDIETYPQKYRINMTGWTKPNLAKIERATHDGVEIVTITSIHFDSHLRSNKNNRDCQLFNQIEDYVKRLQKIKQTQGRLSKLNSEKNC
jgi:hypothetical protein